MVPEQGGPLDEKAQRFLDRMDKRSTRRLKLRKKASNVSLTQDLWDMIDRNRIPMGMTRSTYIAYCVYTVARKYDRARAVRDGPGEEG